MVLSDKVVIHCEVMRVNNLLSQDSDCLTQKTLEMLELYWLLQVESGSLSVRSSIYIQITLKSQEM